MAVLDDGRICDGSSPNKWDSSIDPNIDGGKLWYQHYTTCGDLQWLWEWLPNTDENKEALIAGADSEISGIRSRIATFRRVISNLEKELVDLETKKTEWTGS